MHLQGPVAPIFPLRRFACAELLQKRCWTLSAALTRSKYVCPSVAAQDRELPGGMVDVGLEELTVLVRPGQGHGSWRDPPSEGRRDLEGQ